MSSDPALLSAAAKQLDIVISAGDGAAYLGWWLAWSVQDGIDRDDLVDLTKARGLPLATGE